MTDDLMTQLERAAAAQEEHHRDLQPEAARLTAMHSAVRRRRAVRVVQHGSVAAAVVGVLAVGGWFGLRTVPAEPAVTPSPSVQPTSGPTPSPVASAVLVPVERAGLPPMDELPDGVPAATGPGWFVVAYGDPFYQALDGGPTSTTLALSAPTGELYHLVDVPAFVSVARWVDPFTVRAAVTLPGGPERRVATIDLRTGDVVLDDRVEGPAELVGTAGQEEVWETSEDGGDTELRILPLHGEGRSLAGPPGAELISPDGRAVTWRRAPDGGSLPVLDLVTGTVTRVDLPAEQECVIASWFDATGVLATCVDRWQDSTDTPFYDQLHGRLVRVDTTGGPVEDLAPITGEGLVPYEASYVSDGVVAVVGQELLSTSGDCYQWCTGGTHLWSRDSVVRVGADLETGDGVRADPAADQICEARPGGDGLLLRVGTCFWEIHRQQWWTLDSRTGAARLVAPQVSAEVDVQLQPASLVERSLG
jgi:hypothetical protein